MYLWRVRKDVMWTGLGFLAGGLLARVLTLQDLRFGLATEGWQATSGRIVSARVASGGVRSSHTMKMQYDNAMAGKTYVGTLIGSGARHMAWNSDEARARGVAPSCTRNWICLPSVPTPSRSQPR